jgi:hypothetical protein
MRYSVIFAAFSTIILFFFVGLALIQFTSGIFFAKNLPLQSFIVLAFIFIQATRKEFLGGKGFGYTGVFTVVSAVVFLLLAGQNIMFLGAMFLSVFFGVCLVCVEEKKSLLD